MISVYPCKWIEKRFVFFYCNLDFTVSILYDILTQMIRMLLFYLTQDDTSSYNVTVTALICMITAFIAFHESSLQLIDIGLLYDIMDSITELPIILRLHDSAYIFLLYYYVLFCYLHSFNLHKFLGWKSLILPSISNNLIRSRFHL
jgi:hypothetical protein